MAGSEECPSHGWGGQRGLRFSSSRFTMRSSYNNAKSCSRYLMLELCLRSKAVYIGGRVQYRTLPNYGIQLSQTMVPPVAIDHRALGQTKPPWSYPDTCTLHAETWASSRTQTWAWTQ